MKAIRFFLEIFVLIGALFLTLFFIEKRYSNFKTAADHIFERIEASKEDSVIVIAGNSHMGDFDKYYKRDNEKLLNVSIGGQDLFREFVVMKKMVATGVKIKKLVLGLDYDVIGYNQVLSGQDYIDKQYYPHVDTLYDYSIMQRILSSTAFFRSNRDISFLFRKQSFEADTEEVNFVPFVSKEKTSEAACKNRALERTSIKFDRDLIIENSILLESIISLCNDKGIDLIIVDTPKSNCYRNHSNKANVELSKKTIENILAKHNLVYYDFYDSPDFDDNDYTDYDHLNKSGWNKLLNKLMDVI